MKRYVVTLTQKEREILGGLVSKGAHETVHKNSLTNFKTCVLLGK